MSPNLSIVLAIFSLTFFIVICELSNFYLAKFSDFLKNRVASLYYSFTSLKMPLEKLMIQFIG